MRQRALILPVVSLTLALAACGDDSGAAPSDVPAVESGEPFPEERCEANRAAGTVKYHTGFDFAAAASILEVVVADEHGYFDELCLDVELTPSFSTTNYPLVASNEVQFASAGNFSEVASFSQANEADLVALSVDGHAAIDVLMVKPGEVSSLADLAGKTIGVKGVLPPSIAVMLQQEAGLVEGDDFQTVLLDGFDPTAHWALPDIVAIPGWRSNEPGTLERTGIEFDLYDPAEFGIPGSFGLIYTNREFLESHPTAAEDFMRAAMRGLADAIADPAAAAEIAVERINGNGNPSFLSPEGEAFRWTTDAASISALTPSGAHVGVPIPDELEAQIAAYEAVGVYGDAGAPPIEARFDATLVAGLYADDGKIIWPA